VQKFKRKVFYLGGFDPRGVRFYHQLYREQAGRYDRLTGEGVTVGGRRAGPAGSVVSTIWSVDNEQAGVETDYEFAIRSRSPSAPSPPMSAMAVSCSSNG
jgi:hypothetical protein